MNEAYIHVPKEIKFKLSFEHISALYQSIVMFLELNPIDSYPVYLFDMIGHDILKNLRAELKKKAEKLAESGAKQLTVKLTIYELLLIAYWIPIEEKANRHKKKVFELIISEAMKYNQLIPLGNEEESSSPLLPIGLQHR